MREMDPRRTLSGTVEDPGVQWSAKLVSDSLVVKGSKQRLIVEVQGPAILNGPVQMQINDLRIQAEWQGEPGQQRSCVAFTPTNLQLGVFRVYVLPQAGPERPRLQAGRLRVR
jgi:hypothetical protein